MIGQRAESLSDLLMRWPKRAAALLSEDEALAAATANDLFKDAKIYKETMCSNDDIFVEKMRRRSPFAEFACTHLLKVLEKYDNVATEPQFLEWLDEWFRTVISP